MPMTKDKKVQWHPGFYGAMHLELRENKEDLEFAEEIILNTLPLRVDMLVVKKKHDCEIKNEIGKIFGRYNLIEYKSPSDSLNYDVFLKGIAYAYLYKSNEAHVDDIRLEEVTLSFIREMKPVKLFKILRNEKFIIEEKGLGIYYIIKEGYIKIQIIVSRELSDKNHIWLNVLSNRVKEEQIVKFLDVSQSMESLEDVNYLDSVWEVMESVNRETVQKVRENEMTKAWAEIVQPKIDEAFNSGFNNGSVQGKAEAIIELLEEYGTVPDDLSQKILNETELERLRKWNKLAAKVESIEEFKVQADIA